MLKSPHLKFHTYILALLIILFSSCNEKREKTNSNGIYTEKDSELESKINFRTVAILNETNRKVLDIASIAFNNSKELKESQIILKIKKDHQKLEYDLKRITEENLIIIPEPIFELNLNQNFLKGINSSYYLISLLEKEIKYQITLLDSIEKVSKDKQFRNFADKSKDILIDNNDSLEELLEI
ncbi:hypothetical protein [uncultured Flavobacterium sp.]|uniref:hypothetical protein n=1 Tax=uncultured Flavobacterium sp. TaxID=165435 RepID=UPI0030EC71DF|tara:strand:+ start:43706 stop:44254 length:549 start_codon:yes stop_codon:yes gene_type:complete